MVSEDKIAAFLKLQQIVLDTEESTKLLEQFLPIVLGELNLLGFSYIFYLPYSLIQTEQLNKRSLQINLINQL